MTTSRFPEDQDDERATLLARSGALGREDKDEDDDDDDQREERARRVEILRRRFTPTPPGELMRQQRDALAQADIDVDRLRNVGFTTRRSDPDAQQLSQLTRDQRIGSLIQAGWPLETARELNNEIETNFQLDRRRSFGLGIPRLLDLIESPLSRTASTVAGKVGEIVSGASDPVGSFQDVRQRTADVTGQRRPAPLGPGVREGGSLLVPGKALSQSLNAYDLALKSLLGELTLVATGQAPRSLEEARERWAEVHPGIRWPAELAADFFAFLPTGGAIAKRGADITADTIRREADRLHPVLDTLVKEERGGGRIRPRTVPRRPQASGGDRGGGGGRGQPPRQGAPPPARTTPVLPDLQDFGEAVGIATRPDFARRVANLPGIRQVQSRFNPAAIADDPAERAIVGRAILRDEGDNRVAGLMSLVDNVGREEKLFGDFDNAGLIAKGPLKGKALNDIRTNPGRYDLTDEQQRWVAALRELEEAKLTYLKDNGIKVPELTFEEGGQYAGRRVYALVGPDGQVKSTALVGSGPGSPGSKAAFEQQRRFPDVQTAIEAGYRYLPETDALALNIKAAYRRVADKRMSEWFLREFESRSAQAGSRAFSEATVNVPAFQGRVFVGPGAKEAAEKLTRAFDDRSWDILSTINKANAAQRLFVLAGDASQFLIQLLFAAGQTLVPTNLKTAAVWPQAFVHSMRAIVDPDTLPRFMARHPRFIKENRAVIMSSSGNEFTEALQSGVFSKGLLGTLAKPLKPFQRGFETALDVSGVLMRDALVRPGHTAAQIADIEQFINAFRGLTSSKRLGVSAVQQQFEAAVLLAPRYRRAIASIEFDAMRGAFGQGGVRGRLAVEAMGKAIIGTTGAYIAITEALGQTAHLDPTSSEFLTIEIAGQKVGPGSKVLSDVKFMARIVSNPENLLQLGEANPGFRWARSQFAAGIATTTDLFTGRNVVGEPSRDGLLSLTKRVIGENFVPLYIQSLFEGGGTTLGRVTRATSEFFGGRGRNELAREEADRLMLDREGVKLADANIEQKRRLEQDFPDVFERIRQDTRGSRGEGFREGNEITVRRDGALGKLADLWSERMAQNKPGAAQEYLDARSRVLQRAVDERAQLNRDYSLFTEGRDLDKVKSPLDRALFQYWDLFQQPIEKGGAMNEGTGLVDFNIFNDRLAGLEADWTEEQRAYVDRNAGAQLEEDTLAWNVSELYDQMREVQWWDLHRVAPVFQGFPEWAPAAFEDYRAALRRGEADQWLNQQSNRLNAYQFVKEIERRVGIAQLYYRSQDPALDEDMTLLLGKSPVHPFTQHTAWRALPADEKIRVLSNGAGNRISRPDWLALRDAGFDTLEKIAAASPFELSRAVPNRTASAIQQWDWPGQARRILQLDEQDRRIEA